jgi:hypothetical protein
MYTDSIILRELIVTGLTTKGSELTAEELDTNFKLIWQDLGARLTAGALPAYDSVKTYSLGNAVKYDDLAWVYVYATPSAGTDPGSDPAYWSAVNPEYFAHQQNTDTKLAEGTADEVSAAEIRTFIDTPPTGGDNLANADLTQTDPARLYDIGGGTLRFDNGQVIIGDTFSTTFVTEINGAAANALFVGNASIGVYVPGATAIGGYFEGASKGVACYSSGAGASVFGSHSSNTLAGHFDGGLFVENYGAAGSKDGSALVHMSSNSKGFLQPVLTTAQKSGISTPATGLSVFDSDFARPEYYNGSYWAGDDKTISLASGSANLTVGSNYFFGNLVIFPTTTEANRKFLSPYTGVIREVYIRSFAATVAGDRSISIYARINGATDYLVATVNSSSANREFVNTGLNIPITKNSDTISFYAVASGGTADSTGVYFSGYAVVR